MERVAWLASLECGEQASERGLAALCLFGGARGRRGELSRRSGLPLSLSLWQGGEKGVEWSEVGQASIRNVTLRWERERERKAT